MSKESGLYYLQSRYYDPEIGRFINADSLVSTGQGLLGNNMFAYCLNSPAVRRDVTGTAGISYTTGDESPWSDLAPRNLGSGGGAGGSGDIIGGRFGGGHGNPTHKKRIENHMDELQASGQYSQIYGNRALSTAGQVGNQRPDVIGIKQDGTVEVWEFASPSQATGTAGYYALQVKIDIMQAANPSAIFHEIIPW